MQPGRLHHGASPCGLRPHKQVIIACHGVARRAEPDGARVPRAWVGGGSPEVRAEAGFDPRPVGIGEATETTKDDAVVESKELETNDARQRKTGCSEILELAVARPRVMASRCDHCQDGVAGLVEGGAAEHQSRSPFFGGLV